MTTFRLCLLSLIVLAQSCALQPVQTPPPVEESSGGVADAPIDRDPTTPDQADATPPPTRDTSSATTALLASAGRASDAQDYTSAIAYLERAVRIEPRQARLWIALSAAHQADGNLAAANQHVRKAIALAGEDAQLQREAWLQLASIRRSEGNTAEADAITRRYSTWRG